MTVEIQSEGEAIHRMGGRKEEAEKYPQECLPPHCLGLGGSLSCWEGVCVPEEMGVGACSLGSLLLFMGE